MKRQCDSCTKCCEGYLSGEGNGKTFYPGKPCHFLTISKGCTIYANRPKDPCVSYSCEWLTNIELPEWLKPEIAKVIITKRTIAEKNLVYWDVIEAGEKMQANVLSWLILYSLNNKINLRWVIDGGVNWIGEKSFIDFMNQKDA